MEQSTGSSVDLERKSSRHEFGTDSTDFTSDCRSRRLSCSSVDSSTDEANARCSSSSSVPGWTIPQPKRSISDYNVDEHKDLSEIEVMKERFAKLLLGEDMSGSGNGVCSALAISNAITNLCVAVFGQLWRLEPLSGEKKAMWRREMDWLLNVTDHIIELIPSWQIIPDGSKLEIMTCKPRADLFISIPALHKLDNLLIDMLDSFEDAEFWYVDFQKSLEEKWWLPVPRLPPSGLHDNTRKKLQNKRECCNQIMKAAMAINSMVLSEMQVPESYLETLPKTGRACLGDLIYRYINSSHFSSDFLLDFLDLSAEHQALEIANRIEAAIYVWRMRLSSNSNSRIIPRSGGRDKREVLARRAEIVLLLLKQRFPNLTQTSLETCKILHNKDIGKSILESYSRVIESLAFNIVARMDDLLYVDDLTKKSEKKIPMTCSVPVSSTPRRSGLANSSWSPASMTSPIIGERTPFLQGRKPPRRGNGVKKVLSNYLGAPSKVAGSDAGREQLPETCPEPARGREKAKAASRCLSMSIG